MALYVHRSNRMEALAERLGDVVAQPLGGPITPECIVVQGLGMERWLSMELARRFGVWANPEFPFPRRLFLRALDTVLGSGAEAGARFEPAALLWSIAGVLSGHLARPEFAPLESYLRDDPRPSRRLALAERIARVFDEYVVYRPRMVLGWEAGEGGDWQAVLWRALTGRLGSAHIAARIGELVGRLDAGSGAVDGLPARVSLFGISALPPLYVGALSALARRIEVHLFILNPSSAYWGEIRSRREILREQLRRGVDAAEAEATLHLSEGNPLLASLGRLGRDFQAILESAGEYTEDEETRYEDPGTTTMLHTVQSDVLNLRHRRPGSVEAPPITLAAVDGSIAIHACHGPMREVEVLHDQLVALFELDHALDPRDVVVMSPAIDTYAPFIDAVFGRSPGGPAARPEIPYHIADRSLRTTDEVVDAFVRVIEVVRGRMGASQVLDLLALDAVRERFGIAAEELDRLRRWVSDSGIRWGADAAHRQAAGQPPSAQNTWRFGLDRLLLGCAMRGEGRDLYAGVLPYDEVEGGAADLLGRFVDFCEALFEIRSALDTDRSLVRWAEDLAGLVERAVANTRLNRHQHVRLRGALRALAERAAAAGFDEALDLESVLARLEVEFREGAATGAFLSRGVTFCAMVPMRSIPFRVVCLLGLGDGAFPRVRRPLGFDRMAGRKAPGDRSARDDDRTLFLEALLSARDRLLVTYVGHGIRDNRELPPSVVVSELLDVLEESFSIDGGEPGDERVRREVVVHHPLQSFSPRYFCGGDRLFSYAAPTCDGARLLVGERRERRRFLRAPLPEAADLVRAVSLEDLVRFFENPARALLERRLGLWLRDGDDLLDDREPVELGILEAWAIGNEILQRVRAGEDPRESLPAIRASGRLPAGTTGDRLHEEFRLPAARIAAAVAERTRGPRQGPLALDAEVDGVRLTGVLRHVWPGGLVAWQYSKVSARHEVGAWIRHLALCLAAPEERRLESVLLGRSGDAGVSLVRFRAVDDPAAALGDLLRLLRIGLCAPLPFFPKASFAYCRGRLRKSEEEALADARSQFADQRAGPAERDDPSVDLLCGAVDPLESPSGLLEEGGDAVPSFAAASRLVLEPMLAHRETEG